MIHFCTLSLCHIVLVLSILLALIAVQNIYGWSDLLQHGRGTFSQGWSRNHTCQVIAMHKVDFQHVCCLGIGPRNEGRAVEGGGYWFVLEYYKYMYLVWV